MYETCDAEPKVDSCVNQLDRVENLTRDIWADLMAIRETLAPRPLSDGQATPTPAGLYNRLSAHGDQLVEISRMVTEIRRQVGG